MAALTKKAMVRATVESMVLNRIARRMDFSSFSSLRLWTRAECKYRLCGITVAPMMPMATTIIPAWRKLGTIRASPISEKSGCVCGSTKISMK